MWEGLEWVREPQNHTGPPCCLTHMVLDSEVGQGGHQSVQLQGGRGGRRLWENRGWAGRSMKNNVCQLRASQSNAPSSHSGTQDQSPLSDLATVPNSQAGPFLVLRLVLLLPGGLLARWELRHYFICREERRAVDTGPAFYTLPRKALCPFSCYSGKSLPLHLCPALPCPSPQGLFQ